MTVYCYILRRFNIFMYFLILCNVPPCFCLTVHWHLQENLSLVCHAAMFVQFLHWTKFVTMQTMTMICTFKNRTPWHLVTTLWNL